MKDPSSIFVTAARGLEPLLAEELAALGAAGAEVMRAGVRVQADLRLAYRLCLWSRVASRVLLPLARGPAPTPAALYDLVRTVHWRDHLSPRHTLLVDVTTTRAPEAHSHFLAQKAKDAVVDQVRDECGERPSVAKREPDLRINIHLDGSEATVSLDLSGESLHRRGYRTRGGRAPLKESLAAAILLWAGWPARAARGEAFLDPMCGSGTFCIEAALWAGDVAPALGRRHFGFTRWLGHEAAVWEELVVDARARREHGRGRIPKIVGWDRDADAVRQARANAGRAGVAEVIELMRQELLAWKAAVGPAGLVVTNPPYGERLGEARDLQPLYSTLGAQLKAHAPGWAACVLAGSDELGLRLGLKATRRLRLFNGAIPCRLLELPIAAPLAQAPAVAAETAGEAAGTGRAMLANRLRKNLKRLGAWLRREGISCFRVYDADLPEYAVAVDRYEDWVVIQEYEPPAEIPAGKAARRLHDVLAAVPEALGVAPERLVVKLRRRQGGAGQYTRRDEQERLERVHEGDSVFWVNLSDYLDTGLFLDGRGLRRRVRELARGRAFLNLFAYTGTATVAAARGGATSSLSVDLSRTYLAWAERNFAENGLSPRQHELVAADCREWLARASGRFGLILLDPPTFSNSKRMERDLDLERDHVELVRAALRLLDPGGALLFVTHMRRFRLDTAALADVELTELTEATRDPDFARGRPPHLAWLIERQRPRPGGG